MFLHRLRSGPLGVAMLQLAATLLMGLWAWWWVDGRAGLSAAYGGVAALLATLALLARKRLLELNVGWDATRQARFAKRALWERMVLVGGLLALGFLSGRALAGWMVLGFVVGQAMWLVALAVLRPERK